MDKLIIKHVIYIYYGTKECIIALYCNRYQKDHLVAEFSRCGEADLGDTYPDDVVICANFLPQNCANLRDNKYCFTISRIYCKKK